MKLTYSTDTQENIETEGAWFAGHIQRDGEVIFSFNVGNSNVDYTHFHDEFSKPMTWAVGLWLDDTEEINKHVRQSVKSIKKRYPETEHIWRLEKWLKDYIESQNPLSENAGIFADIISYALLRVDYRQIAVNILSKLSKD